MTSRHLLTVKQSAVLLYADDTKCINQIRSHLDCAKLQRDLDSISKWSKDWSLSFNELIHLDFYSKTLDNHFQYVIKNYDIPNRDFHRDLDIIMSSDLSNACLYDA